MTATTPTCTTPTSVPTMSGGKPKATSLGKLGQPLSAESGLAVLGGFTD